MQIAVAHIVEDDQAAFFFIFNQQISMHFILREFEQRGVTYSHITTVTYPEEINEPMKSDTAFKHVMQSVIDGGENAAGMLQMGGKSLQRNIRFNVVKS